MQNIKNNLTNLEVLRVYPPGTKRGKKTLAVHQDCDDTSDINEENPSSSSSPHKIDLPFRELQANTTQALGQHPVVLPVPFSGRQSESYEACEFQIMPSSELLLKNDYSMTVTRDVRDKEIVQASKSMSCGNELRDAVECKWGPTRISCSSQNTVASKDKGSLHPESHTTSSINPPCMEEKVRNNAGKKPYNTKKLNRPQHQIVKFLEDYTEFGDDLKEIFGGRGKHCPTLLESTVDGSIVKGARRFVAWLSSKL